MKNSIVIIGIGGAGAITIKRMKEKLNIHSIVIDTKNDNIVADEIILVALDTETTEEIQLSDKDLSKIKNSIEKYDIIMICGGLGGKTGTHVIHRVAQIASEENKMVVAVMYKPFAFEGMLRKTIAEKGAEKIIEIADFSVLFSNDLLTKILPNKQTFAEAFTMMDAELFDIIDAVSADAGKDFYTNKSSIINKLNNIRAHSKLIESCKSK